MDCFCQCSPIADAGVVNTHRKSEVNYMSVWCDVSLTSHMHIHDDDTIDTVSLTSHTLRRERKGLVTLQPSSCRHSRKLAVTNEIHALCRLHPLSWSSNYATMCLANVSFLLSNRTV